MKRLAILRAVARFDFRRRFRDRLLAGMLVVAILPLVVFGVLVAADLGAISRNTTDAAHRAMVEDQEARELGTVADQAKLLDVRLSAINGEVHQLRDQVAGALAATPVAAAPLTDSLSEYQGVRFSTAADTTLIVSATGRQVAVATPQDAATRAGRSGAAGRPLVPFMQGMRRTYPEIEAVWIVDKVDGVIRTVPSLDVRAAVDMHRLDPSAPLGPDGETIFSTSQRRFSSPGGAATGDSPADWWNPSHPGDGGRGTGGPFWTDPYQTRQVGDEGVTVWMPVGDGQTLVGADITVQRFAGNLLQTTISGEPGAYPVLLSSSNKVLAGSPGAQRDFRLQGSYVGTRLPQTGTASFDAGLNAVEKTGRARALRVVLGGADRELFTAPVYTPRWVLAASVPVADVEPDVTGLARGVDSGIRRLMLIAAPIAVFMCLLAFALATAVARRLVGPIRALTTSARRLAEGHTDEAVPAQGCDEVGLLATSLEHMRREINTSRDTILGAARELEHRVTERTGELRMRNEDLVALNGLARSLTQSLDPEVILREALATIRAVLPVDAGIGLGVDGSGELCPRAVLGSCDPATKARLTIVARAAADEQTMVSRAVTEGVLVGLPLRTSSGTVGVLAVMSGSASSVRRRQTLLSAIADQAGLALRTAQLSLRGRDLAVLEERTRLAREIHDTLAQQLTAVVVQLEAAEVLVRLDPGRATDVVVTAREQARLALQEARRSVWDLRPASLAATGLVAALELEVRRWAERTGITASLHGEELPVPLALQPHAEVALLRILQEALENIGKHTAATSVRVVLAVRDGVLEVSITDDGCGFDAQGITPAGSFGLTGMEERARLAGARFAVESAATGTRVAVMLPLPERSPVPA